MIDAFMTAHPLLVELGLTLTHFLWQGAAIAICIAGGLLVLRRRSAQVRYTLCGAGLLLMLACVPATFWRVHTAGATRPVLLDRAVAEQGPTAPEPREVREAGLIAADQGTDVRTADPVAIPDVGRTGVRLTPATAAPREAARPAETFAARLWRDAAYRELVWSRVLAGAAVLWAVCVCMLGVRLLAGGVALRRWRRDARQLSDELSGIVWRLAERLGLERVGVHVTHDVSQPLAFGLLRPVVLLPVSMLTNCPMELIEAMVAHELAHIRRHDIWVNVAQRVIETLLFYHPGVWWLSGRMRLERELCCDDMAVEATGRRVEYAEALVAAARSCGLPLPAGLAMGMAGGRTTLGARVRRVLRIAEPVERRRVWLAGPVAIAVLIALAVMGGHIRAAQSEQAAKKVVGPAATPTTQVASVAVGMPGSGAVSERSPRLLTIETHLAQQPKEGETFSKERQDLIIPTEAANQFIRFIEEVKSGDTPTGPDSIAPEYVTDYRLLVSQVREDLAVLGLMDGSPGSPAWPWRVRAVVWQSGPLEAGALVWRTRLVLCEPFESASGKPAKKAFAACKLQRMRGWPDVLLPVQLSILPVEDEPKLLERFYRGVLDDPGMHSWGGAEFRRVTFSGGYPMESVKISASRASGKDEAGRWRCEIKAEPAVAYSSASKQPRCFADALSSSGPAAHPGARPGGPAAAVTGRPTRTPSAAMEVEMVAVRPLADGVVMQVLVKPGQEVKKGDLLVKLDDAETRLELRTAELRYRTAASAAEIAHERYKKGLTDSAEQMRTESDLELANLAMERWKLRLQRTEVRSPIDGRVLPSPLGSMEFLVGTKAEAGQMLILISPATSTSRPAAKSSRKSSPGGV